AIIYTGSTAKATVADLESAIDVASGVRSNVSGALVVNAGQTASTIGTAAPSIGALVLHSSTGADLNITGAAEFLKQFGLTSSTGGGAVTVTAARTTLGQGTQVSITGSVINASTTGANFLNGTATGDANAGIAAGDTITVNGKTISFASGDTPTTAPS